MLIGASGNGGSPLSSLLGAGLLYLLLDHATGMEENEQNAQWLVKGDGAALGERPLTALARKVALSLLAGLAIEVRHTTTAIATATSAATFAEKATVVRPGLGSACKPQPPQQPSPSPQQQEKLLLCESLRSLVAVLGPTPNPCGTSCPSPGLPPRPSPGTDTEMSSKKNAKNNDKNDNNPLETLLLFLGSDK